MTGCLSRRKAVAAFVLHFFFGAVCFVCVRLGLVCGFVGGGRGGKVKGKGWRGEGGGGVQGVGFAVLRTLACYRRLRIVGEWDTEGDGG